MIDKIVEYAAHGGAIKDGKADVLRAAVEKALRQDANGLKDVASALDTALAQIPQERFSAARAYLEAKADVLRDIADRLLRDEIPF